MRDDEDERRQALPPRRAVVRAAPAGAGPLLPWARQTERLAAIIDG
jgi:hypothetical protein